MVCNKCGKENLEGSKFCGSCGNNLVNVSDNNQDGKPKKIEFKDMQVSTKIGYITRFICLGLIIISFILNIIFIINLFGGINNPVYDDASGYGFLALIFIAPIFGSIAFAYYIAVLVLTIVLPSIWISKSKKVATLVEVLRIIGLTIGAIMSIILLMFSIYLMF